MTETRYKNDQDFFDNSTTEEKIRIISNNIEERQTVNKVNKKKKNMNK